MEPERLKQLLLAVLLVVLAVVVWERLGPGTESGPALTTARSTNAGRPTQGQPPVTAPDVHIDALRGERPAPDEGNRNLFRFKPKPPAAPPRLAAPVRPAPAPSGPPPAPSLPPIPLKYVGYIQTPSGEKIASFTDAVSPSPVQAKEGQTILGRYRLWRIGVESVEMSYIDGTGRQTIRQTGQ